MFKSIQSVIRWGALGVILLVLVAVMVSYSVRFTEQAVVATFGRATPDSVVNDAGIKLKWPYPVQTVTKYDTRTRVLETQLEAQQTADDRQIIVEAFLFWRVNEPLSFYQRFSNAGRRASDHYTSAERVLNQRLRSALSEIGNFGLDELFTADAADSRMDELEQEVLAALAGGEEGERLADYGVEAAFVGISQIKLSAETTAPIVNRMIENRDRIAKEIEAEGNADAAAIRAKAESDAQRILAFTEQRAQQIRAQGDKEATEYISQMNELPELAMFLTEINLLREAYTQGMTVVVPSSLPGLQTFQPDFLNGLAPGEIPTSFVVRGGEPAERAAARNGEISPEVAR
ncbi:MAG: SPFH domain-containing protein [Planctomycetota bacterium]